jgi:retron-type reverse transcriptase
VNLGKPYRGRNSAEIFSAFTHRVFKAVQVGDKRKARLLQKLILKSTSARFLAIRQVSQLNAGKKTAGIDGKKSLSFEERFNLEELLKMNSGNWKHQGLREIPIPKKDGTTRMLKIPTIADRAWQCLAKYALEPACALPLSTHGATGLELGALPMMHKSTFSPT